MGKNWPALVTLGIAAVIYAVFGMPWANMYGHAWISIVLYAVLALIAIYCRCNRDPIHSKIFHRRVRRTPQSL